MSVDREPLKATRVSASRMDTYTALVRIMERRAVMLLWSMMQTELTATQLLYICTAFVCHAYI